MKKFVTVLCFLFSLQLFAQENFSIHKLHQEEFGIDEDRPSLFAGQPDEIIPLQYDKSKNLSKTIYGYLPDWEYQTARNTIDYSLLTHIGAFDFVVSSNGSVTNPAYWPWNDVINTAHQNGVKVILTGVCFDPDAIRSVMTNASYKQNFFNNVKTKIQQYNLDGVNIDFEGLYTADRGSILNVFMSDLTNFIHTEFPGKEVSFAGPAVNWGGWNLQGLANSCDFIFIMGYAFYGGFSSTTGPCAPLAGGSINISNTVNIQYANADPSKLVLGVPYYGLKWKTKTDQPHSSVISYISSTRFKNDASDVLAHSMLWANDNKTPWYRYQLSNEWYQVWFDSDSSLGLKYEAADARNFKGVGMWALGYDGARSEYWNELRRRYFSPNVPVELVSFNALSNKAGIELSWSTATETNNKGFQIERLTINDQYSDQEWNAISFIDGFGTTTEKKYYSFYDENLITAKYKYRLKQIDFDGSFEYSNEIEVEHFPAINFSLDQNYPNPFNPATTIGYRISETGFVNLKIYDMLGNEVAELVNENKSPGRYEVDFDAAKFNLSSGIYFCQLKSGSHNQINKMILMK